MMDYLHELTRIYGVSGEENAVSAYIKDAVLPYADKVYDDRFGNLIAVKHGFGPKVLITAHMDTAGLIVTSADDDGFLNVSAIGEWNQPMLNGTAVQFRNGVRGIFTANTEKDPPAAEGRVDIGAKDRAEALLHTPIGTTATFSGSFVEMGTRFSSFGLNNRAGCYCLIETLRRLTRPTCEVYFAFTVLDAVNRRGSRFACMDTDPEIAIALSAVAERESADKTSSPVSLGKGAAIKICDRSSICSAEIIEDFENLAKRKGFALQRNVFCSGGAETGGFQNLGTGVKVGGIGIPVRNLHSAAETVDRGDLESAVSLLASYLEK